MNKRRLPPQKDANKKPGLGADPFGVVVRLTRHDLVRDEHDKEVLEAALERLRPRLHRYCVRMTGSVIDGEDVAQEAIAKAFPSLWRSEPIRNIEKWLFRIAHNSAFDLLRRRAREETTPLETGLDLVVDPHDHVVEAESVATSLRIFMRLPVLQPSAVPLMDVCDYSLREIADVLQTSVRR